MAARKEAFDFKEMEMELQILMDSAEIITDQMASALLDKIYALTNKMKSLQLFCFLVLYYNKLQMLSTGRVFRKHDAYVERLKNSNKALCNDDYIRMLISQEHSPQFPSLFLFNITYFIIVKGTVASATYMQQLGKAWINHYDHTFAIESPHTIAAFGKEKAEFEEDPIITLRRSIGLLLFRLKETEELISSYVDDEDSTTPSVDDQPKLALLEAIRKLRATPQHIIEKTPLAVLEKRDLLMELARKTCHKVIFSEVLDACRNYDRGI